ncbi:hypothetical protein [Dendronalium sp. ChiSLP03b]|uniref:hypothetical protein n=1 Tax=Dendronalium sp. ChiSLP03b TaxID=3075381 RepID=UPI002AD269CD|nr:hypothetical protein [Dendronalium sp. ChiSLP03b]MDZ8206099.1 hypothetical protein [Dendronalium sp. ChiSLP03b]
MSDRLVRFSELTILLSVPNDTLTTISAIAQIIDADAGYWSDTAAISKQAELALCFSPTPIQAQGFPLQACHSLQSLWIEKTISKF